MTFFFSPVACVTEWRGPERNNTCIPSFLVGEDAKACAFAVSPSVTECFYLEENMTEFSITVFPGLTFRLLYMWYRIRPQTPVFHFYSFKDASESYVKTVVLEEIFCRDKDKLGGGSGVTFWLYNTLCDASHGINRGSCHKTLKRHTEVSGTERSKQEHSTYMQSKHGNSYY